MIHHLKILPVDFNPQRKTIYAIIWEDEEGMLMEAYCVCHYNITVAMLYRISPSKKRNSVPAKEDMDARDNYMIWAKWYICSIIFSWDQIASRLWEIAICTVL